MKTLSKTISLLAILFMVLGVSTATAQDPRPFKTIKPTTFDEYLTQFDYKSRKAMKINSKEAIKLLAEDKAVLVDIRFKEEPPAWRMGIGRFIPLNELPARYADLPKDKVIITACPHKDRSNIAAQYLRLKGYDARYMTDGLLGMAENLRGDNAKNFVETTGVKMP